MPLVRLLTQPLCYMVLVFKDRSRLTARVRPGIPTFRFEPPDLEGDQPQERSPGLSAFRGPDAGRAADGLVLRKG